SGGLAGGGQRRNPAVGWIDDEGGAPRPDDFRPAVVPRIVVRLRDISVGRVAAAIGVGALERLPLERRGVRLGEHGLVGELSGTLERRQAREVPGALQVGMAVARTRRRL